MTFNPHNILIIDFGQLGDVVMSLPALQAIRARFPLARITVAVGRPGAQILDLSGCCDASIEIDRVSLRDGFKLLSLLRLFQIVKDVRRRQFDFVIDLHSYSETNLLGFLSGAPQRLFSRRPGRSLDFLARFDPPPAIDRSDPKKHLTDRYLAVLAPLGITNASRAPQLVPRRGDDDHIDRLLKNAKANSNLPLVGLYPGAGHAIRRWPLEKFADLASRLIRNDEVAVLVFTGPEEKEMVPHLRRIFPPGCVILDNLRIRELVAAQVRLSVFVANDTGPMHLAAAVGAPIVLLLDQRAQDAHVPVNEPKLVIRRGALADITVEEVYDCTRQLLVSTRTTKLFSA